MDAFFILSNYCARISRTVLNNSGKAGILVSFMKLQVKFAVFSLWSIMLAVFFVNALDHVENRPSIHSFWAFLSWRVLAFVNAFSVLTKMTVFFPFLLLLWYITSTLFLVESLHFYYNYTLSCCIILLTHSVWFASVLLRIFALLFISSSDFWFFFLVIVLIWLWYQEMLIP